MAARGFIRRGIRSRPFAVFSPEIRWLKLFITLIAGRSPGNQRDELDYQKPWLGRVSSAVFQTGVMYFTWRSLAPIVLGRSSMSQ